MVLLKGREEYPIYFGAKPALLAKAADLRKNMTPAEKYLWDHLRKRQLKGFKFRRQHPLNKFVADFFCYESMLVVEVDGDVHDTSYQKERDNERTKILKSFGMKELRFRNEDVLTNISNVLKIIEIELKLI